MSTTNFSTGRTQTKTFEELLCSPSLVSRLQQESLSFAALNILLSITAFAGNSLILIALHKESSLHPPSKLFYRCLATTDLLVGLISQPLAVSCWIFSAHEHWIPCRYTSTATFIVSHVLCGVSLLTMTAISVDRLLALLLGLRYRHIVTLKRTYIVVVTFLGSIQCRCFMLHVRSPYNRLVWPYSCTIMLRYLNCVVHENFLRSKSSSCTNTRSCSTAEPTKCSEYHKIQKGSVQCTVGSVGISCLLFAVWFTGNCNQTKQNLFMVPSHHEECSRHINFLKLNVKSVSVLLENKWSETSSKANDQTWI